MPSNIVKADAAAIERAADELRAGALVAFPTETVYGLGADASNPVAVRAVFEAKGRPADHPLIVHLPDAGRLDAWAREVPAGARALARAFWPGPLTLILPRGPLAGDEAAVDELAGLHGVAPICLRRRRSRCRGSG